MGNELQDAKNLKVYIVDGETGEIIEIFDVPGAAIVTHISKEDACIEPSSDLTGGLIGAGGSNDFSGMIDKEATISCEVTMPERQILEGKSFQEMAQKLVQEVANSIRRDRPY